MKNLGKKALRLIPIGASLIVLTSCAYFQKKGVIKSGAVSVAAVENTGKPATLATTDAKESIAIPKDTLVTITEHEATPTAPAFKVTELHFNSSTEWLKFRTDVAANTGTVDNSVALKKAEIAESRPLLYASIASLLACGFFLWRVYPTPALACGAAAVVFFLAWKVSGVPDWLWVLGACGLAGAVALYLGHERGEKAAVVAGTPITPAPVAVPATFSPVVAPNPVKT